MALLGLLGYIHGMLNIEFSQISPNRSWDEIKHSPAWIVFIVVIHVTCKISSHLLLASPFVWVKSNLHDKSHLTLQILRGNWCKDITFANLCKTKRPLMWPSVILDYFSANLKLRVKRVLHAKIYQYLLCWLMHVFSVF